MTELIVMLTKEDKTIANALDVFGKICDLPFHGIGFKDVGLDQLEMQKLASDIKESGKKFYFEIVSDGNATASVEKAIDLGAEAIMGGAFDSEILKRVELEKVEYYPYAGDFTERPCQLLGDVSEIIEDAQNIVNSGAKGITLLAYRHQQPKKLLQKFTQNVNTNLIVAGSIDDTHKIRNMQKLPVEAFTIGTAFVDEEFPAEKNMRAQIEFVLKEMKKWGKK
jgi:hypothetical protein